jgi:hypothetical protein
MNPADRYSKHKDTDADSHTNWQSKSVQDHLWVFDIASARRISKTLTITDNVAYNDIDTNKD